MVRGGVRGVEGCLGLDVEVHVRKAEDLAVVEDWWEVVMLGCF